MTQQSPQAEMVAGMSRVSADYAAARSNDRFRRRRTGYNPMGSGADYHYRSEADFLRMIEEARDMDRNDSVIQALIDRAVDNTLQDGLKMDAATGDEALDADLNARWMAWCEDKRACDSSGERTWCELEWLALRHCHIDGDVFALPRLDGTVQLVEAHRCRNPRDASDNMVLGVEMDAMRRRTGYWFTADDLSTAQMLPYGALSKRITAYDRTGYPEVLHVYCAKRVTQTRGVTSLAPIFNTAGMFEDLQFNQLVKAVVASCYAIIRNRELNFEGSGTVNQRGAVTSDTYVDGTPRRTEGIAPGMEYTGKPGETLSGFSPNVPNAEFFPHAKLTLQLMSINLGIPLMVLMLDGSETNFSGWRGAFDQAKIGFKRNQRWLRDRFCRPVYMWKVAQWLADDAKLRSASGKSGVNAFGHRWNVPAWPYIEPFKDAQADALRQKERLISPRRLHQERGRQWDEVATEIVADQGLIVEKAMLRAKKLNAADPEAKVDWRELIGFAPPKPEPNEDAKKETEDAD